MHAPDQTYIRLRHLHCHFDLAISLPFWIIAWIETIFMEFRGPKAPVNLHGSRLFVEAATSTGRALYVKVDYRPPSRQEVVGSNEASATKSYLLSAASDNPARI
jgi:hypothetical protein